MGGSSRFRSGAPLRLTSWPEKGLNWSLSDELSLLQMHVQSVVDKDVKLVNVVQMMLVFLVLPCQRRACNLWEYDLTEHQTLRELYDSPTRTSRRCSLCPANHGRAPPRIVGINYPTLQAR